MRTSTYLLIFTFLAVKVLNLVPFWQYKEHSPARLPSSTSPAPDSSDSQAFFYTNDAAKNNEDCLRNIDTNLKFLSLRLRPAVIQDYYLLLFAVLLAKFASLPALFLFYA